MSTATETDWREKPPPGAYEMMSDPDDYDCSTFVASSDYNADKHRMACASGENYEDVRMRTVYMVWDPEHAETQWQEDQCDCWRDHPEYRMQEEHAPTCSSRVPAKSVYDFWDESGIYCPWVPVKRGHPNAVKFRRPA